MSDMKRRDFLKLLGWTTAGIMAYQPMESLGQNPPLAGEAGHFKQVSISELERQFVTPPDDARIWVYWFWLNGNITKEGAKADLEAMKRVGVGGALIMEVDQGAPPGPLSFSSPKWQEMFTYICKEASKLGIKINMNNDGGWCGSGGPWVTPELSMQRVVWTETKVTGGSQVNQTLSQPIAVDGFYRDIAVLAFPTPSDDAFRIPNIEALAEFGVQDNLPTNPDWQEIPAEQCVDKKGITDITGKMDKQSRLVWDAPEGDWTIVRFGHTTTGVTNHPSPIGGLGLETDKLSQRATDFHFNALMGKLIDDVGDLAGETLVSTHIDSWETGSQNWTPTFRQDFKRLRGYDPLTFLPAVTGRVVGSMEITQRFLWDFRKTISDLLVENYSARMRDLAAKHGMRLSIEGYSGVPVDEMKYGGSAVEPMGELWSWGRYGAWNVIGEMTSAGHVYGHRIIGMETFTADNNEKWQGHPAVVKDIGDWAFCQGINRFVVHRFAMQPWVNPHYAPGMSMGPWGLHYERTETWWEQAKTWHEYVARCQHILRQGDFIADICYMQQEGGPSAFQAPNVTGPTPRPGFNYDGCPAEAVIKLMRVKNGRLTLPGGMSYRVLALPDYKTMSPQLLRKIKELVDGGATVVGPRPEKSPSLSGYPHCDQEVEQLVEELWSKGKIISDRTPEKVLEGKGVSPDFTSDHHLNYIHRKTKDADIYFVANPNAWPVEAICTFRVEGREPELWDPQTGNKEVSKIWEESLGGVKVHLRLDWKGSIFVVFRHVAQTKGEIVEIRESGKPLISLNPRKSPPSAIKVIKAMYGPPNDPARTRDETSVVQQLVDEGNREFPVVQIAAIAGDPALNIVKTLHIEYRMDNRTINASYQDGEVVRFYSPPANTIPPFMVVSDEFGRGHGLVFQAGKYEIVRHSGAALNLHVNAPPKSLDLTEKWNLVFPPGWGAPRFVSLDRLVSWSEHPDEGVRYFSGTGRYHKTFTVPSEYLRTNRHVFLDLGNVEVMAQVWLNGKDLGVLWKPPFRLDITYHLKHGENSLEVAVTNLWINRMIGDEQLPEDSDRNPDGTLKRWPKWLEEGLPSPTGRLTFTTWRLWHKNDPLVPSGLIGPVKLFVAERVEV